MNTMVKLVKQMHTKFGINSEKEIGQNQKHGSSQLDLVKPKGWTAPDLSDLVEDKPKQMTLFEFIPNLVCICLTNFTIVFILNC